MSNAPAPTGEQLRVLGILKALQIDGRTSTRTLRPGRPYPPVRFDQVPRYVLDAELFRGPDEWGTPPVDVGAVLRELVIRGLVQEAAPDPCMIQQAEYRRPGGLVVFVSIEEHPDGSSWLRAGVSGGERFPRMRRFPMYTERLRPDPQAAPVPCYGITAAGLAVLDNAAGTAMGADAHSDDFRSIRWGGIEYSFTKTQAACVERLWQAWEAGVPDVGDETLMHAAGSDARRLRDVFNDSPAWGTIIVEGATRGCRRLSRPVSARIS